MSEPTRPLPDPDEHDTGDFWRATADGELRYQQCEGCGTIVFPPRRHCTGCVDGTLAWRVASGRGTVYSFSVVRQSYHPFFRGKVPYVVAWIDLEEGPRLLSNVVDVADPAQDVRIGMAVELTWEVHEAVRIPLFRPA
jgi:uncharacterized OB-fold protein